MKVSLVPQQAVGSVWKDVDEILKRAVETVNDKSNVIDILDGIFDGTYVLWVVLNDDNKIVVSFLSIFCFGCC